MITYLKLKWLLNDSLLCCVFLIFFPSTVCAEDWPQTQGKNRDNKSKETGLLSEWPQDGPSLLWTFRHSGVGYSGPAVVGDRIYIMGGRNGRAELSSIKATSGELVWSKPFNSKTFDFEGNSWGAGPRATPTVAGEMIYALAGDGELAAFNTKGEIQWQKNTGTN